MTKGELLDAIKRHYGDTEEDLADLEIVMDVVEKYDKYRELEEEFIKFKAEAERQLADLDKSWRERYRERFFDGEGFDLELETEDVNEAEKVEELYTIDDLIEEMNKEDK